MKRGYDLLKDYHLQGHSTLAADIDRLITDAYNKGRADGLREGIASQAMLELRGRDRFVADLRKRVDAGEKI